MLSRDQTEGYLRRIGLDPIERLTRSSLERLHRRHLERVPFENLDILADRPLSLDLLDLRHKIVERGRGGFCYELNSLFGALLHSLGCSVTFVEARFLEAEGLSPRFDHLSLIVSVPGSGDRLLADVGCGKLSPPVPIPLFEQPEVLTRGGLGWQLWEDDRDGRVPKLTFAETPQALAAFADRCDHHEHHSDSYFRTNFVCTRHTGTGWISLTRTALTSVSGGVREERAIEEAQLPELLLERFGLSLDPPLGGGVVSVGGAVSGGVERARGT